MIMDGINSMPRP